MLLLEDNYEKRDPWWHGQKVEQEHLSSQNLPSTQLQIWAYEVPNTIQVPVSIEQEVYIRKFILMASYVRRSIARIYSIFFDCLDGGFLSLRMLC